MLQFKKFRPAGSAIPTDCPAPEKKAHICKPQSSVPLKCLRGPEQATAPAVRTELKAQLPAPDSETESRSPDKATAAAGDGAYPRADWEHRKLPRVVRCPAQSKPPQPLLP